MTTEKFPNDAERQAAHARRYKRAIDMMAVQAGQLVSLKDEPKLDFMDVANLYATTAANILVTEIDPAAAVAHLRHVADAIERSGEQAKPN